MMEPTPDPFRNADEPLVLPLADFTTAADHQPSPAEEAYAGVPFADMAAPRRGLLLEQVVRRVAERVADQATEDPRRTQRNAQGSLVNAPYDFDLSGHRVEVKSTILRYNHRPPPRLGYWEAVWGNVRTEEHDVLLLALLAPSGLYVYAHRDGYGLSVQDSQGRFRVISRGPAAPLPTNSVGVALDRIHRNLSTHCIHVATLHF
mmetsp:Transcript_14661/g.37091  ORF Transcript_14661/g.37091 Transcript_14661/m.37091 type:complete len:204 (-) Transcript_14661:64-675(-)